MYALRHPITTVHSLSYLDHNFEEIVTLEHVADLLAVGVLAHQFDEGSLGGVVAAVQTYPDDSQPLVRLDHLLLRLSTCVRRRDIATPKDIGNMRAGFLSFRYTDTLTRRYDLPSIEQFSVSRVSIIDLTGSLN